MNGLAQSGVDRCATAESRVRAYWSNGFTVTNVISMKNFGQAATAPKLYIRLKKAYVSWKSNFLGGTRLGFV